jgi:sulfur relay (sulfurtransferase) complex TusBCD TusD component (DsrE family)
MTDNLVEARRQHLTAEIERCRACGDRRGLADASASLRILGYLCDEEVRV